MAKIDSRIDAYIEKSAVFAQPILIHLRQLIHKAYPDIEETIKWGFPHFDYKGMLCSMAAFKNHCAFNFWKAGLLADTHPILKTETQSMGHFDKITSLNDLPADTFIVDLIRHAIALNEQGISMPKPKVEKGKSIEIPTDFLAQIQKNKFALQKIETASYSFKKEYIDWINEAKTSETRNKRIETAVEWIAEGKGRNWKYER